MKLDLRRIGAGTVVAAGLGVALLVVFLRHAQSTPDSGPTAGALDDGFSAWFGAGLGLALGSALCALSVRRGSRPLSGVAAGVVAYGVVMVPILVLTRPGDMSLGEALGTAAFFLVPAAIFVALGATVGSFVATVVWRGRRRGR